jgi:hypothetical protein
MGMDILGVEPLSKDGEYFRASIWSWVPITHILRTICPRVLSEEDFEGISFNMGYEISSHKSVAVANKLAVYLEQHTEGLELDEIVVDDSRINDILSNLTDHIPELPLGEEATIHLGNEGRYSVDDQHLAEFANFCRQSGGFQVW